MIKKGRVYELEVRVPTKLGKQTYLVRVIDHGKKALGQKELSDVGMEAVSKRMPAIIISKTGFAKSAKKYWEKELEDLVTLVDKNDLE